MYHSVLAVGEKLLFTRTLLAPRSFSPRLLAFDYKDGEWLHFAVFELCVIGAETGSRIGRACGVPWLAS